ncbi:SRPBCC family protein [Azospirillum thermophilum]|uniref:Coenzyme Q-binding protein COQ10 START domain-containing protein n=1 Tax=Azospirillum thermophilum TaxID=2202148 RepID=A0A2S2CQF1_9PROT|nr:SRPBCC family protein [Azospirillum thermophilum]AWK86702.1 hypothetical protein DEW08_11040 [Azospirillum thermophilum]
MTSSQMVSRDGRDGGLPVGEAGAAERWAAILGGTALGLAGARRGSWAGAALMALGGGLFLAGAAGVPVARALREGLGEAHLPDGLRSGVAGLLPVAEEPTTTQAVVTIAAPPETIFRFWRNVANLPRLMSHLERVDVLSEKDSRWIARGPGGVELCWTSTLDKVEENALITWHTLEGAELPHRGSFMLAPAPGGRGTEVRLTLVYRPPAGAGGRAVSRLFGSAPEQQSREALRRLKRLIETGELPTIEGQPHGTRGTRGRMQEGME